MKKQITLLLAVMLALLLHVPQVTAQATLPFTDDFEGASNWTFVNGSVANKWYVGTATNNGGTHAMYISNDNGTSNSYNTGSSAVVYAYKEFTLAAGQYSISYDWKNYGESSWDYMRVVLAPQSVTLTAGTTLYSGLTTTGVPSGWTALDGGTYKSGQSSWQNYSGMFTVTTAGTYKVVFAWRNDGSAGTNPPAAIDNFSLIAVTCYQPTGLTASNVTTNSADFAWTASGHGETGYQYLCIPATQTPDWTAAVYDTATSVQVNGLQSNTGYIMYVRSYCGTDDQSVVTATSFHTECEVYDVNPDNPYNYGFEDAVTGGSGIIYCWTRINSTSATSYPYASASGYRSGSRCAYFYQTTSSATNQILVSPEMAMPAQMLQVRFWAKRSTTTAGTGILHIGVMTDPADASTFTPIDTIELTNTYAQYEISLTADTTNSNYVAFKCPVLASGSSYIYLDDVTISVYSTCDRPTGVNVSQIHSGDVTVSWTPGGEETSWMLNYRDTETEEWMDPGEVTSPYLLAGLEPNTVYEVRVRAMCDEMSDWSDAVTFRTACSDIDITEEDPYVQGFENATTGTTGRLDCWSRYNDGTTSGLTYPYYYTSGCRTGSKCLYFYNSTSTGYPQNEVAIFPAFSNDLNSLRLRFWAKAGTTGAKIVVGAMSDPADIETFMPIGDTIVLTTTYTEYELPLVSYEGAGHHIAINYPNGSSGYVYVDDVTVDILPTCMKPTGVTVSDVTINSATISWNPGLDETLWNIEYKLSTDTVWTAVNGVTSPYTFNALPSNTKYDVRVQSACASEQSEWANQVSFTTLPALPYVETFNVASIPSTWTRGTGLLNNVMAGTATVTSTTSGWNISTISNGLPANHIKGNIYGTSFRYWMISPSVFVNSENAELSLDIALTAYGNGSTATMTGTDDRFVILATTDDGATWNIIREWNNSGSQYVYNNVATTGEKVKMSVAAYNNQLVKFALYGESTVTNADNDFHFANFAIMPCPSVTAVAVDSIAVNSAYISWNTSSEYFGDYNLHISTTEMTDSALNALGTYTYTGAQNYYKPTDLDEFTQYYAYARVNCDDPDAAWVSVAFHTQSACVAASAVTIDNVEKYSFRINWTMPEGTDTLYTYEVMVKDADDNVAFTETGIDGKTRSIDVAGLDRNTSYIASVRTSCSAEAFSGWMNASVTTPDLDPDCSSSALFEGTVSQSSVPYNSCYNYGLSEQIYLASEMNGPAAYGKISFNVASTPKTSTIAVYMLHTTKTSFASGNDWVVVSASDKVFEGPVAFTTGWNEIELTTPFVYNGTDNLMLVVDNNTGSYSCTMNFYGVSGSDNKAIYLYQDDSDVNPLAAGMPTGNLNTTRPAVKLISCYPAEACPALRIAPTSEDRTHNSARINWTPAKGDWANTYELYVATEPMTAEPAAESIIAGIDTTSYVLTGLQSSTNYYVYVRIKCDKGGYDDGISGWSPVCEFQTECPCYRPEGLSRSVITSTSVDLQWFEVHGATAWDVEVTKYVVGDSSIDTVVTIVPVTDAVIGHDTITGNDTVRYTLTGLDANMPYSLRLRSNCGEDGVSHWAFDGVNFTTKNNNTAIDTITFRNSVNVMSYWRTDYSFDIVVRADQSLENMRPYIQTNDNNATVKYNGQTLGYYSEVTFSDDSARLFTVYAADTNVTTNYMVYVHHETCATPYGIAAGNIGRRNATITWNMGGEGVQTYDYVLSYVELSDSALAVATPMQFSDSLRSFDITVDRDTMCYFYLRHNCGEEQSPWISTSFRSQGLTGCDGILVCDAQTYDSNVPLYGYWADASNQKTQSIYPASMLTGLVGKSISELKYFVQNGSNASKWDNNNIVVRMGITTADDVASAFATDALTQVYSGYLTATTTDGMTVTLDNPFTYNGGNLLIEFEKTEAGTYSSVSFYAMQTSNAASRRSYNGSNELAVSYLPKVDFRYCFAQDACPDVQGLTVTDYQATEATLEWTTTADYPGTYDIIVSTDPVAEPDSAAITMTVATTEATLTGLNARTNYYAYVRANCENGDGSSNWVEINFTTQASCYAPLSIASAVTGKQTAHVAWVPGTDQQANNFAYVLSTVAIPDTLLDQQTPTVQGITTDNVDVTGLASATHYYLYLHNVCGEGDGSPWVSTEFTTPAFQPAVINLTISDVTYNTFVASWERDTINFASETEWQIAWAPTADTAAVLTWTNVTATSRVIFGLDAETEYAFYVRPYENATPGAQVTENVTTLADPGSCTEFIAGTSTVTQVPMFSNYQGSYNVQIYTAEELAAQGYSAGNILNIAFYQTACGNTTTATKYQKTTTVWMKNTSKSSFSSTTDWEGGMTEVMAAKSVDFNKVNDWVEMTLDQPFAWDGTSNLAVAVLAYSSSYTTMSFRGGAGDAARSLYSYRDATNWVITDGVPSITNSVATSANRANIKLCFPAAACPAPKAVAAENIQTTSADITWRPGGTETQWEYVYSYTPMTEADLAAANPTTVDYPRVAINGLNIDADVYVYVRSICDESSTWARGQFRTIESCSAPISLYGFSPAENTMKLSVDTGAYGVPMNYVYEYWMVGSNDTISVTSTDTAVVTGLEPGTYAWRAKTTCQTETPDGISRWTNGNDVTVCGVYNISDTRNYAQGFENISYISEACMDAYGDNTDPYISTSSYTAHTGSKYLYLNNYYYDYGYESFVYMPKFNSNEEMFFSFYYKNYSTSTSYGQFIYGYQTANGVFYPVDTLARTTSYALARYSMNNLPDSAANVAIKFGDGYYYGYLDDIRVAVQREATVTDTLGGLDNYYNKYGFSIYRSSMGTTTDSTFYHTALNGIVDTAYTLNLHIGTLTRDTVEDAICPNTPSYQFYTKTITNPTTGVYRDTIAEGAGNYSIHMLRLTVLPVADTLIEIESICQGETFVWHGRNYTVEGTYSDTVRYAQGCDSTVFFLNLYVHPTFISEETETICPNGSYTWRGRELTEAGVYRDSFQTYYGCDSIYQLTLSVATIDTTVVAMTISTAKLPYTWKGQTITRAGTYYATTTSVVTGCDSVIQLNLSLEYPAVTNLRGENIKPNGFTAKWTKGGTETRWYVLVTTNKSNPDTMYFKKVNVDSCVITGLNASTTYKLTVTPEMGSKVTKSKTIKVTTTAATCAAPTNLVAQTTGLRNFSITWQNGSTDQPNNFTVVYADKPVAHPEYRIPNEKGLKTTSMSVVNKSYNTTYYIYVRNVYAGVASDWVSTTVTTCRQYEAVTNLASDDVKNTSFHLTWTKHQFGSESRWNVVVRLASDSSVVFTKKVSTQECLVTGLNANTAYIATVSPAIGARVTDPASINVTTIDNCAAPVIISAVRSGRTIEFTWRNGSDYQANNFTFIVKKRPLTALDTRMKTEEEYTGTSYTVSSASTSEVYYFYIKNVWNGVSSEWVSVTVPVANSSAPEEDENSDNFIAEEVIPADAFVNMSRLYVDNLIEGVNVTIVDASGRTLYNDKADNTHMEFDLSVRGVYMVVLRGEQNQIIKVVY